MIPKSISKFIEERASKPWGFEGTSLRESKYYERGATDTAEYLLKDFQDVVDTLKSLHKDLDENFISPTAMRMMADAESALRKYNQKYGEQSDGES